PIAYGVMIVGRGEVVGSGESGGKTGEERVYRFGGKTGEERVYRFGGKTVEQCRNTP
nr:hypothetical protein [Tanacetum cinerariifolium]